jgi:hypothetical protein
MNDNEGYPVIKILTCAAAATIPLDTWLKGVLERNDQHIFDSWIHSQLVEINGSDTLGFNTL